MMSAMGTSPEVVAMDEERMRRDAAAAKQAALSRAAYWVPLLFGTLAAVAGILYSIYA